MAKRRERYAPLPQSGKLARLVGLDIVRHAIPRMGRFERETLITGWVCVACCVAAAWLAQAWLARDALVVLPVVLATTLTWQAMATTEYRLLYERERRRNRPDKGAWPFN